MARRNRQTDNTKPIDPNGIDETVGTVGSDGTGQSDGTRGTESVNRNAASGTDETRRTDSSVGNETVGSDPAAAAGTTEPKKRRGRPPGSGTGTARRAGKVDQIDRKKLAGQIQGLHVGLAMMMRNDPEAQQIVLLSDAECINLGNALGDVFEHYGIVLDGPVGCLVQLAAVGGMIYVPRLNALGALKRKRKAERQAATMAATPEDIHANGNGAAFSMVDPLTGTAL